MSYDIFLRGSACPTCGRGAEDPELPEPTYNLTPIFDLALTGEPMPNPETNEAQVVLLGRETERPRGLRILSGRRARDTVTMLSNALARSRDPTMRRQFVTLEPPNKWGTLPDAVWVFERLREAAERYPDHVWEIR